MSRWGTGNESDATLQVGAMLQTWKVLHIFSMFLAVTVLFAPEVLYFSAARNRDVVALRRVGMLTRRTEVLGTALFILGIVAGLLTAIAQSRSLFVTWLITAYVIVALLATLGGAVEGPWLKKMAEAAVNSPDDRPSEELQTLLKSPRQTIVLSIVGILYACIIFVMVSKPFS